MSRNVLTKIDEVVIITLSHKVTRKEVTKITIAERLVQARGNIPRDIVASAVGISLSAISMYENGQRVPRDEIKVKLADYYHTTVQALFFDTDSHDK